MSDNSFDLSNIFYKNTDNDKLTSIIKNKDKINHIPIYLLNNEVSIENKKTLLKSLLDILRENYFLIYFFQIQTKFNEYSFIESLIELYIKEKEENEELLNLILFCKNYIPITNNIMEIVINNLSKYFRNEAIHKLDEQYLIKHLNLLNLLINNTKDKILETIYFNGLNSKLMIKLNEKDSTGFKIDYPLIKNGFFTSFSIKINKKILDQYFKINKGIEINLINFKFDNNQNIKLSLNENYSLTFQIFNKIKQEYKLKQENFDFNSKNEIMINLIPTSIFFLYINEKLIFKIVVNYENLQLNKIIFFENYIGEVDSIFFSAKSLIEELISLFIANKDKFNSNHNLIKFISKIFPDDPKPFYLQSNDLKSFNELKKQIKILLKNKEDLNFFKQKENINNYFMLFMPFLYNEKKNIIDDICGNFIGILGQNDFVYYNFDDMKLNESINNLLPILELMIYPFNISEKIKYDLIDKSIITENTFFEYFSLIKSIVIKNKYILNLDFIESMSIFISKFPDEIFSVRILIIILEISSLIINNQQNIEIFQKKNKFLDLNLLNLRIILKFKDNVKILWDKLYEYYKIYQEQLQFFPLNIICLILRSYDKNRYNQICCEDHYSIFFNENTDKKIYKKIIMEPSFTIRYRSLFNILLLIFEKYCHLDSFNIIRVEFVNIFKMLSLDISPCLQTLIINLFKDYFSNIINIEKKKKILELVLNKECIELILYVSSISILNVQTHIIDLIQCWMIYYFNIIDNYFIDKNIKINQMLDFIMQNLLLKHLYVLIDENNNNFNKINEINDFSMNIPKINKKIEKNNQIKEIKKVKITNFFNNIFLAVQKKDIFFKLINWMECKNKFGKNNLKINSYMMKYIAKFSTYCEEKYTLTFINSIEKYFLDETCLKEIFLLRSFYKWLIQSIFIFSIEKKDYNQCELIIEKLFDIFSKLMNLSFENLNRTPFQTEEIFKIYFINTYILILKKKYKNQEKINEIRNIARKLFNILLQTQKKSLIYRIKASFEFMIIFNNSEEYENGNLDMSLYNERIPNFIMKNLPINIKQNNNKEIFTKEIWLDYELFDKIIGSYEDEFTDFSDYSPKNYEVENKEYFKDFIKEIAFNPKKKNIIINKFQNILFKKEKIFKDNHYSAINILEIYIILICINLELTKSTDEINYWEQKLMKLIIFSILISINTSKKYEFNDFIQEKLYNILTFSIIYLKKRNQNYYFSIINNYIEPIFQFNIREKPSIFQKESQIDKCSILKIFKPIYTNLEELGIKNPYINDTELKSINDDEINIDIQQQIKNENDNQNNNNNIIIPDSILKSKKEIKFTISILFDEKKFYLNLFNFHNYIKIFKENYPKEFKENSNLYYFDIENEENILYDSYINEKERIEKIIIKHSLFLNNLYKQYFESYFILEKQRRNKYKSIKKKLFSWRGFWSDKNLFFTNPENLKLKIKNHYTKEMSRILLVPILDIDYYLSDFRKFNKEDLFLNKHQIYKIHLDIDEILQDINYIQKNKMLDKNKENIIDKNIKKEEKENLIYDVEDINFIHNEYGFNFLENSYKNYYPNLWYNYLISFINELENNFYQFNLKHCNFQSTFEYNNEIVKIDSNNKTFGNLYYCCLVKSTNHVKGIMRIDSKNITFTKDYKEDINLKDPNFDIDKGTCFGSLFISKKSNKDLIKLTIKIKNIKMILIKNYYYKKTAIEIFTKKRKSYYFNFNTNEDLEKAISDIKNNIELIKKIYDYEKKIIGYYIYFNKSKAHSIYINEYEEKWSNYKISSLEYLMRLNLIGNRSFIDLTQYPVFPWVISNYSDEKIDNLENEIRKLNKPMGMLEIYEESKERKEIYEEVYETTKTTFLETHPNFDYNKFLEEGDKYLEKYEKNKIINNEDNFGLELNPLEINQRPYFYGSHYSNPTYVCHYLMRIFPYSQILIEIQGDKFDNPDRLFCSLNQTFFNATTQKVDIRELTPEFYYLPELYNNINKLNFIFGNEEKYKDFNFNVELPPWANNKNYFVTMLMRKFLENNKLKINKWIDLIFGINQKGKKSEEAKNIFQANTYINIVNIEKIDDIDSRNALLGMVEMGMTPLKLLNEESKEKLSIMKYYQLNYHLNLSKGLELINGNEFICIELITKNYDNIVNIFRNGNKQKIFPKIEKILFYDYNTLMIFTNTNYYYKMKINITESFIEVEDYYLIKIESNNLQNYVMNYKMSNLKQTLIINNEMIIKGGYHNKILEIINYNSQNKQSKNECYYQINESKITYLAISQNNKILFCGEKNGTIEIYKKNILNGKMIKKKKIYYHNDEITCISVCDKLDIFASVSYDCFLNIYTIKSLTLIRSIKLSNNKNIYGDYVFISYSPLPCVVVYILPLKIFKSFTINGSFINEINEDDQSNQIYSPIIFKNLNFEEFLIYGTDNGYIKIRKFPEMNLINKILVKKDKIIRTIEISEDRKYCYAWYEGNKIILIKEKKVVGAAVAENFATIGFHL